MLGALPLPRISRRRRRRLNETLPAPIKSAITKSDPFYLLATPEEVIDKSIDLIRGRAALKVTSDKLFVDLGFNNRKVFDRFYDALGPQYRWIGLELQSELVRQAHADEARYSSVPVEWVQAAAATANGPMEMALDGADDAYHPNDGSTTVLAIARDKSGARRSTIEGVDIAEFLYSRSHKHTKIVIKMDVEGAEYELLDHLIAHPVAERIDTIFCEFHWRRFPFPDKFGKLMQTQRLIKDFNAHGVMLLSWR